VRRPTQLLRVRGLKRALQHLEQRGRLAQEGVDKLDHEGAIARRYAELLKRLRVEDATLVGRCRCGMRRLRQADPERGTAAQGLGKLVPGERALLT
jgi:hypothetical protein